MNTTVDRWLLPDGIEEILPERAARIEAMRRRLIDVFRSWGYDQVMPPLIEFTESLHTGTGRDIDLLTFKITDQLSGRMMGLRADITPQAARMDAHSLKREGVNRLCYAGHVVHTRAKSALSSRTPIKMGVELFGSEGANAELEVVSLLLECMRAADLDHRYVDLGHVGVFRELAAAAKLDAETERQLFDLLQIKALSDIDRLLAAKVAEEAPRKWLAALPRLAGDERAIEDAEQLLAGAPKSVLAALAQLRWLSEQLRARYPEVHIYLDLSELRGYRYHTGLVFGAFAPGVGNAIANGGRYDHVGESFGRARPAVGFDMDLKAWCDLSRAEAAPAMGVFSVHSDDPAWWQKVCDLRAQGERVVVGFNGQRAPLDYQRCDRELVCKDDAFVVERLG